MSSSDEKDLKKEIEHVELGHMGQPLDAEEIQHRKEMIAQHGDVDLAAKILEEAGSVEWSDQDDKRVLRMIDIYVMIPMAIGEWTAGIRLTKRIADDRLVNPLDLVDQSLFLPAIGRYRACYGSCRILRQYLTISNVTLL